MKTAPRIILSIGTLLVLMLLIVGCVGTDGGGKTSNGKGESPKAETSAVALERFLDGLVASAPDSLEVTQGLAKGFQEVTGDYFEQFSGSEDQSSIEAINSLPEDIQADLRDYVSSVSPFSSGIDSTGLTTGEFVSLNVYVLLASSFAIESLGDGELAFTVEGENDTYPVSSMKVTTNGVEVADDVWTTYQQFLPTEFALVKNDYGHWLIDGKKLMESYDTKSPME